MIGRLTNYSISYYDIRPLLVTFAVFLPAFLAVRHVMIGKLLKVEFLVDQLEKRIAKLENKECNKISL